MIDIQSGTLHLKLTPYERIPEPEEAAYDRIMVWVEFSVPSLKTEFRAEFAAGQLEIFRDDLKKLHQSLIFQQKNSDVVLSCLFKQVELTFMQSDSGNAVGVNMVLRPEDHADSVMLTDFFGLDESYFPAILFGLDEIINWST
ncbi:hypothetical protein F3J38_18110 [Pantoea sp. Acro-805]|jgi:hypothetical protein|uniref:Uncharacterized protein n=1 Tax=Candidatus Pantoea formicae TaxID=2608355 RepID=A0ABX0QY82_9GAMM|nr:hypothetical protein [Pantoea formicae]MDF7648231.1 hypothetical protein [Erwiniaceae bacterium L1_54_3]NIF01954.1 hypothetical protein [Pantoea formicae]